MRLGNFKALSFSFALNVGFLATILNEIKSLRFYYFFKYLYEVNILLLPFVVMGVSDGFIIIAKTK